MGLTNKLLWKFLGPFRYRSSKGKDWFLFSKDVPLRGGRPMRIYFFNSQPRPNIGTGRAEFRVPRHLKINENLRNGFPTLRRRKLTP